MEQKLTNLNLQPLESEAEDENIDTAEYHINMYGTDFTTEILSKKLDDGEIIVPKFQREYVWTANKASKLIESFLLGLPVPQIFLYRPNGKQELWVVDGQQRLRSINYFLNEKYENNKPFRLLGVKSQWEGKLFSELKEADKRKFKNAVLRSSIFEQLDPQDNSSIIEIFVRLNTGGMALTLQEIRNCVIDGYINTFLKEINLHNSWREILNKQEPDTRMKDIEIILRFFALAENWKTYKKPMKEYITTYMRENRNKKEKLIGLGRNFQELTDFIYESVGKKAFRIKTGINIGFFDSVMVALKEIGIHNVKNFKEKHNKLSKDEAFLENISNHTTDVDRVKGRIKIAQRVLSE